MRWTLGGIVQLACAGCTFTGTALALLSVGWQSSPALAPEIDKGVPETPLNAADIAGNYVCHDGNAYRVVLTLNANGTYWVRGSSCLKSTCPTLPPVWCRYAG